MKLINTTPKVSIITACYNSGNTLKQTIESVLNQTYTNIELVLIDGGSRDNTIELIKSYETKFTKKNLNYRWITEPDKGIYDALNKGITLATGEFIGVLGSDDWLELDALSNVIDTYNCDKSVELIFGAVKFYRNEEPAYTEQIYPIELYRRTMHHQGIVYRKSLHEKFGYYSLNNKVSSDYEFLLKCKLGNAIFNPTNNIIANFRLGGTNNKFYYIGIREEARIQYTHKVINKKQLLMMFVKSLILKYFKK